MGSRVAWNKTETVTIYVLFAVKKKKYFNAMFITEKKTFVNISKIF